MYECLNRKSVEDFIKRHASNIHDCVVNVVTGMLPQISNYHEEDKTFSFRIFLGAGELPSIKGRPHFLRTLALDELTPHLVAKVIKNIAVFCNNGADVLIFQDEDKVSFGVVYFDIEQTGLAEISFLRKGFIIMGSLNRSKVVVFALDENDKPDNLIISFDFSSSENLPIPNFSRKYNRNTALWSGIFKRVKKEVHGTICLIVSPDWSWEKDSESFSRGAVLQEPVSIIYGDGTDNTRKLDDGVRMLLSMMDFDGMTIVDTQGNIRAYHCFVKIDQNDTSTGGSRHIAFETLKKKNNNLYKAVYFQSHEGYVEFTYLDGPNNGNSITYFDTSIMNELCDSDVMEKFIDKVKQRKAKRASRKPDHKNELLRATYMLFVAHYRIDNFYTEPELVNTLSKLLDSSDKLLELEENETLAMFVIDTLLICFVGNTYGYSQEAEIVIRDAFKKISLPVWKTFFENENFIEDKVVEALAETTAQKRWDAFKAELESVYPELKLLGALQNINVKDFYYINKAYHQLKIEG